MSESKETGSGGGPQISRSSVIVIFTVVEAVLPEIIKEAPIGDGYKTVDYAKVVPLLVEAIKDLSKELEEVKKQLKHN